jgi:hypothetical protein
MEATLSLRLGSTIENDAKDSDDYSVFDHWRELRTA